MSINTIEATKYCGEADRSHLQLEQSLQLLHKGREIENIYWINCYVLPLRVDAVIRGRFPVAPVWELGEIQPKDQNRGKRLPGRAEKTGDDEARGSSERRAGGGKPPLQRGA